jgi:hypothetical protein
MRTVVASTAFDQLPPDSKLAALYRHPTLLKLVSRIVGQEPLYLSADPLGCCSTAPLRTDQSDLALKAVAATIQTHDQENPPCRLREEPVATAAQVPPLHTLNFRPGTLSIFSGSRSLHRVTRVEGRQSRLVAVLTYGQEQGFCNSAAVQNLFWGRSVQPEERNSKG